MTDERATGGFIPPEEDMPMWLWPGEVVHIMPYYDIRDDAEFHDELRAMLRKYNTGEV